MNAPTDENGFQWQPGPQPGQPNDGRLAAFTVTKLEKTTDGQLQRLNVDYVVWKKQGDL